MSQFFTRLRLLKSKSQQTQREIAKNLGLRPQTMSYYMNGREPDFDTLIAIAKYFDVTTDYLLGLTNDPHRETVAVDELGVTTDAIDIMKKVKKYDPSACLDAVTELLKWANDLKKEI